MSESGKTKHNDAACRQRGLRCSSISHLDEEVQHEVTLNLQVAGCQWAAPEIRWYHDPLKENCQCPPILVTILFLNDYSTTNMVKKSRFWKNRTIKTGDSVMVGDQPTDVVIPWDSISDFILLTSIIHSQSRCFPHCMSWFSVYDNDRFEGLLSKTGLSSSKTFDRRLVYGPRDCNIETV